MTHHILYVWCKSRAILSLFLHHNSNNDMLFLTMTTVRKLSLKHEKSVRLSMQHNPHKPGQVYNRERGETRFLLSVPVKQHFSQNAAFRHSWQTKKEKESGENTPATLHAVMQMFPHLRAVEDLEPLPLSEAEVILGPGFVIVKSHEQSHPCRETKRDEWWLELVEVNCMDGSIMLGFPLWFYCWVCSSVSHMGCLLCNSNKKHCPLPLLLASHLLPFFFNLNLF